MDESSIDALLKYKEKLMDDYPCAKKLIVPYQSYKDLMELTHGKECRHKRVERTPQRGHGISKLINRKTKRWLSGQ